MTPQRIYIVWARRSRGGQTVLRRIAQIIEAVCTFRTQHEPTELRTIMHEIDSPEYEQGMQIMVGHIIYNAAINYTACCIWHID